MKNTLSLVKLVSLFVIALAIGFLSSCQGQTTAAGNTATVNSADSNANTSSSDLSNPSPSDLEAYRRFNESIEVQIKSLDVLVRAIEQSKNGADIAKAIDTYALTAAGETKVFEELKLAIPGIVEQDAPPKEIAASIAKMDEANQRLQNAMVAAGELLADPLVDQALERLRNTILGL